VIDKKQKTWFIRAKHLKILHLVMEITLRDWELSDLDRLVSLANNPQIAANMTDGFPSPFTEESAQQFIERTQKEQPSNIQAICADGEVVGSIGIYKLGDIFRLNAELGYWLGEPYWGKGIMTEAVKLIVEYGFKNWQLERIFARPLGKNNASQKVLEKAGLKFEYRIEKNLIKNEILEDELIYSMRIEDFNRRMSKS
jgi:RimJ/RimL family protein N-acetyltransferase